MKRSFYVIFGCLYFLLSTSVSWHISSYYSFLSSLLFVSSILLVPSKYLQKRSKLHLFFIVLSLTFLSHIRVEYQKHIFANASIAQFNDYEDAVSVRGIISEEPDIRSDSIRYTIESDSLCFAKKCIEIAGNILAKTELSQRAGYGDYVEIQGLIETPSENEDFSYKNYLLRYGITSIINDGELKTLQKNENLSFTSIMLTSKVFFERQVNNLFTEPQASLMAGILIGSRRGIPDQIMEQFNITGLTHIIAISGYNITIIINIIMGLFAFLPRKTGYKLAILCIILFTIFVGASAAVVRAAIMGILGLLAIQSGRKTDVTVTILFTACLMVLYNPLILWYDAGFQLSFLAVFGLVYVAPHIEKYFEWLPEFLSIRESVIMTIAAQIAALPLIIFLFHRLSIISPLSNLLVAPFLPFAMLFGFLAVVFSFILAPIGWILGFVGNSILSIVLFLIEISSIVPYASVDLPKISYIILVSYYLLLGIWLIKKPHPID